MSLNSVQLGTAATAIITASGETAVLSIIFCNTTAATKTITLYAYASGGSASDTTTILKNISIPSYDTFLWTGDEKIILDTGGVISGLADVATSVSATINYKVL